MHLLFLSLLHKGAEDIFKVFKLPIWFSASCLQVWQTLFTSYDIALTIGNIGNCHFEKRDVNCGVQLRCHQKHRIFASGPSKSIHIGSGSSKSIHIGTGPSKSIYTHLRLANFIVTHCTVHAELAITYLCVLLNISEYIEIYLLQVAPQIYLLSKLWNLLDRILHSWLVVKVSRRRKDEFDTFEFLEPSYFVSPFSEGLYYLGCQDLIK